MYFTGQKGKTSLTHERMDKNIMAILRNLFLLNNVRSKGSLYDVTPTENEENGSTLKSSCTFILWGNDHLGRQLNHGE